MRRENCAFFGRSRLSFDRAGQGRTGLVPGLWALVMVMENKCSETQGFVSPLRATVVTLAIVSSSGLYDDSRIVRVPFFFLMVVVLILSGRGEKAAEVRDAFECQSSAFRSVGLERRVNSALAPRGIFAQ